MNKKTLFAVFFSALLALTQGVCFAKNSAVSQLNAGDGFAAFLANVSGKPNMVSSPMFLLPGSTPDDFGYFLEAVSNQTGPQVFGKYRALFEQGTEISADALPGTHIGEAVYMEGSLQRTTAAVLKISHLENINYWSAYFVAASPVGIFNKMDKQTRAQLAKHIEKYMTCEFAGPSTDGTFAAVGTFAKSTRFIYVRRSGEQLVAKIEDFKPASRIYYAVFPAVK